MRITNKNQERQSVKPMEIEMNNEEDLVNLNFKKNSQPSIKSERLLQITSPLVAAEAGPSSYDSAKSAIHVNIGTSKQQKPLSLSEITFTEPHTAPGQTSKQISPVALVSQSENHKAIEKASNQSNISETSPGSTNTLHGSTETRSSNSITNQTNNNHNNKSNRISLKSQMPLTKCNSAPPPIMQSPKNSVPSISQGMGSASTRRPGPNNAAKSFLENSKISNSPFSNSLLAYQSSFLNNLSNSNLNANSSGSTNSINSSPTSSQASNIVSSTFNFPQAFSPLQSQNLSSSLHQGHPFFNQNNPIFHQNAPSAPHHQNNPVSQLPLSHHRHHSNFHHPYHQNQINSAQNSSSNSSQIKSSSQTLNSVQANASNNRNAALAAAAFAAMASSSNAASTSSQSLNYPLSIADSFRHQISQQKYDLQSESGPQVSQENNDDYEYNSGEEDDESSYQQHSTMESAQHYTGSNLLPHHTPLKHIPSASVDQLDLSDDAETLVSRDVIKRCIRKAKHRGNFAANLAAELFSKEERITCNCTGTRGKRQLSPRRLHIVKDITFKIYNNSAMMSAASNANPSAAAAAITAAYQDFEEAWRKECITAIDAKNRSIGRDLIKTNPGPEKVISKEQIMVSSGLNNSDALSPGPPSTSNSNPASDNPIEISENN